MKREFWSRESKHRTWKERTEQPQLEALWMQTRERGERGNGSTKVWIDKFPFFLESFNSSHSLSPSVLLSLSTGIDSHKERSNRCKGPTRGEGKSSPNRDL